MLPRPPAYLVRQPARPQRPRVSAIITVITNNNGAQHRHRRTTQANSTRPATATTRKPRPTRRGFA